MIRIHAQRWAGLDGWAVTVTGAARAGMFDLGIAWKPTYLDAARVALAWRETNAQGERLPLCPVCRNYHAFGDVCENVAPWAHSMGSGPLMRADAVTPCPATLGEYVARIRQAYGSLTGVRLWAISGGLWQMIDQHGRELGRRRERYTAQLDPLPRALGGHPALSGR